MMKLEELRNVSINGDVREVIKYIPDDSIHLTFTSPPYYNARDYSKYDSYDEYLKFMESIIIELNRVTKEGRFLVINSSPVLQKRSGRQHQSIRFPIPYDLHHLIMKNGWMFIDDIVWVKPEASVKNRNGNFLQNRKPLAYKPNVVTESIMVYRKKTEQLIDWNIQQYSKDIIEQSKVQCEYETSNVWMIGPESDEFHSAVFPIKLCSNIIKFYSFVGDLVFDPFAGRGTLGMSALKLNRYFLLVEKNESYFKLLNKNIINESTSFFYDDIEPTFFNSEVLTSNV